jgi:hypothetical protein
MSTIKFLDLLAPQPELYIKGSTTLKTSLGGLLSLILTIQSLLCFFGFGYDMILRQQPNVYSKKAYNMHNKLNRTDVEFFIAPMFGGGKQIDEPSRKFIFSYSYQQTDNTKKNSDGVNKVTPMKMVACSETKRFKGNFLNITNGLLIDASGYYCIPDQFSETFLYGKFGNPAFNLYSFSINYCTNSTENNFSCLPFKI